MPSPVADRTGLYGLLMARAGGLPNDDLLARMLFSQAVGMGALPPGLGLAPAEFADLMARHFPGFTLPVMLAVPAVEAARHDERDELLTLLREHCVGAEDSRHWMAEIVTTACLGGDHLWQDLGLWSRVDLSRLMTNNFPALAARNTRDMKWKKFLYKQLCDREGVVVCRSPSCEVCVDYAKCFGPED